MRLKTAWDSDLIVGTQGKGAPVTVTIDKSTVVATVTTANLRANRAVAHIVDTVLMPPTSGIEGSMMDLIVRELFSTFPLLLGRWREEREREIDR